MTPNKCLKMPKLTKIDPLWAYKKFRGYGRKVHAKFWQWGTPWDVIYDHIWDLCQPSNSQY